MKHQLTFQVGKVWKTKRPKDNEPDSFIIYKSKNNLAQQEVQKQSPQVRIYNSSSESISLISPYSLTLKFFMRKNKKKKEIQRLREAAKETALQSIEL